MIVTKIIFLLVSTFTTITSMKLMSKLPNKELAPRENIKRMNLLVLIPIFADFVLAFLNTVLRITTNLSVLFEEIFCVFCLVWFITMITIYTISVIRLKNRMRKYFDTVEYNLSRTYVFRVFLGMGGSAFIGICLAKGMFTLLECL